MSRAPRKPCPRPVSLASQIDELLPELEAIRDRLLADPEYVERTAAARRREARSGYKKRLLEGGSIPPRVLEILLERRDRRGRPLRKIALFDQLAQRLESKQLILVSGDPGTGKTVAAVHQIGKRGGLYVSARLYASTSRGYDNKAREAVVFPARRAGTLILDDLGREEDDHVREIEDLLWSRYDLAANSRTICTFNGTFAAFAKRYGPRVVLRWQEIGAVIDATERVRPGVETQQSLPV